MIHQKKGKKFVSVFTFLRTGYYLKSESPRIKAERQRERDRERD